MPYSDYRPDLMGSATLDARRAASRRARCRASRWSIRPAPSASTTPARSRSASASPPTSARCSSPIPKAPGLHHGRGLQRRHARGQVGVQAQHPPLEPLALHRRGEGLPRARRHHHHPLRRPPPGLARHPPADLLRERVRVPRLRRSDRHLRLRGAAREPEDRHRAGAGRALARRAADAGAGGRAVPAVDQGRRQVGQSLQPRRSHAAARGRSCRSRVCRRALRFAPGSFAAVVEGLRVAEPGDRCHPRARRERRGAVPVQSAARRGRRTRRSCTSGATRTASPTRRSAPTRRANISSSAATRPSSTSWATRATTSRSPARSGASSTR